MALSAQIFRNESLTLCWAGLWLQEAASQGVPLPEFSEVEVAVTPVVVAGKSSL